MAYADQGMSSSKLASIVIVVLIHVLLGYALVTGLAYSAVTKIAEELNVIEVKEEKPPEEEPPPPPPDQEQIQPPPVVSPPPLVRTPSPPPPITSVPTAPPVVFQVPVAAPPAPPPPPPPPAAKPTAAIPRGSTSNWVTTDDYPPRALREGREGTTGFRLAVGTDGRPTSCDVTSSSGHPDLDAATCSNLMRRARFTPAKDSSGQATTSSYASRTRWQIPEG